jgi:hypothetical protein
MSSHRTPNLAVACAIWTAQSWFRFERIVEFRFAKAFDHHAPKVYLALSPCDGSIKVPLNEL